ncbi:phytoene desaturase family protein [Miltoncostaea marina]|uniref:phytoene desaturase family protein n=1 Tax=Miltoncostaea marina TaxID=2843215 RepID=UPI001C3DF162|nr:NAD(P)/FAD-dependent oxidoreductase [Miltoncostaea marina]
MTRRRDAVVVGAGPNGLAAAVTLARAGRSVLLLEGAATVGGGCRSAELTAPGFVHDVCSAIHPLAAGSPFFRGLPLARLGVELVHPGAPLAHPLDDGTAVMLERSVAATAAGLGPDADAYAGLMEPLVARADAVVAGVLAPPLRPPRHPAALLRVAPHALRSATGLARGRFAGARARALFAGMAAHSMIRLEDRPSAGVGLLLGLLGHAVGWPVVRGGSQRIADGLAAHLRDLGGEVVTGRPVSALGELPPARAVLLDVTPRQLLAMAGERMAPRARRRLARFRYGPGAFKLDWALDGPIPWRAPECARAATVHLGGTLEEIAASERDVLRGAHPARPYVLLAQQSVADPSRAPAGRHTAWAYCHVPGGSTADMTAAIEAQVERFAPGFRDRVIARSARGPAEMERRNPNHVGGDINGGMQDLRQTLARPVPRADPYATPLPGVYLCSSSTPPGGGVHGMCGYWAARSALRRELA